LLAQFLAKGLLPHFWLEQVDTCLLGGFDRPVGVGVDLRSLEDSDGRLDVRFEFRLGKLTSFLLQHVKCFGLREGVLEIAGNLVDLLLHGLAGRPVWPFLWNLRCFRSWSFHADVGRVLRMLRKEPVLLGSQGGKQILLGAASLVFENPVQQLLGARSGARL